MKVNFNFTRKHLFAVLIMASVLGVGFAVAQAGTIPNPGHALTNIQSIDCGAGQFLRAIGQGIGSEGWECATDAIGEGGGGESPWTQNGNAVYFSGDGGNNFGVVGINTPNPIGVLDVRSADGNAKAFFGVNLDVLNGKEICFGGVCRDSWPSDGGGQWTSDNQGINYEGGNVGIGDQASPTADLRIRGDSTDILRLVSDDDSFIKFQVSKSGLVFVPNDLTVGGNIDVGGNVLMGHEIITRDSPTDSVLKAPCSTGKKVIGGGCVVSANERIVASYPNQIGGHGWTCSTSNPGTLFAYAICANIGN